MALMEIESTGNEVEVVVEDAEPDIAEYVGDAGRLNAVRVEQGLSGKDKSPTGVSGRLSGPTGMEFKSGNASK